MLQTSGIHTHSKVKHDDCALAHSQHMERMIKFACKCKNSNKVRHIVRYEVCRKHQ